MKLRTGHTAFQELFASVLRWKKAPAKQTLSTPSISKRIKREAGAKKFVPTHMNKFTVGSRKSFWLTKTLVRVKPRVVQVIQTLFRRGPNAITSATVVDNTWSPEITRENSAGNRGWSTIQAFLFGVCTASPALVIGPMGLHFSPRVSAGKKK